MRTYRGVGLTGGYRGKAFGDVVQLLMRCLQGVVGMYKIYYGIFRGRIKGGSAAGTSVRGKGMKGAGPGEQLARHLSDRALHLITHRQPYSLTKYSYVMM